MRGHIREWVRKEILLHMVTNWMWVRGRKARDDPPVSGLETVVASLRWFGEDPMYWGPLSVRPRRGEVGVRCGERDGPPPPPSPHNLPGFSFLLFYVCCSVAKSCPTLCNPMGYSLPGSAVHGISQARRGDALRGPVTWKACREMAAHSCSQPFPARSKMGRSHLGEQVKHGAFCKPVRPVNTRPSFKTKERAQSQQ